MSDEEKKAWDNLIMLKYFTMEKEDKQVIDTILNLIEKQQKEIEELKNKNNKLMEELDLTTVYISGVYDGEKKVENKIKAKIEEYKKQIEKMEKDDVGIGFTLGKEWSDLKAKVEFGQSLLEKE